MDYKQGAGGCCIKCEIYLDYKDSYQCNNDECPCHKEEVVECNCGSNIIHTKDAHIPPLEVKEGSKDIEWEKEFDEYFTWHPTLRCIYIPSWGDSADMQDMKDYIKSLLSQQEAKIKKELLEKIEGMPDATRDECEYEKVICIDNIKKLLSE